MIRYFATLVLLGLISNAQALPWFGHTRDLNLSHTAIKNAENNSINFSGVWVGQCDNNPAVDLIIKHENNNLSISYGFMEEKYTLGEIKSDMHVIAEASENNNTMVRWSSDNTALIFINSNLFTSEENRLNVFFSKVSMTLEAGRLIVAGYHYQTNNTLNDFNRDTMMCSYQKK